MKVKIFDFEHEEDLENSINEFLKKNISVVDIKYQTSHFYDEREQIYSFSAMVIYNEKRPID